MKKTLVLLYLVSANIYAMDFTFKGDFNTTNTDNVNSANSGAVKDTYTDYVGTFQLKDKTDKIKFKAKIEKYKKTTSNNTNTFNLSYSHKNESKTEFSAEAFQQKYSQTPTISSDTSSDNLGAKAGVTFNNTIDKNQSTYVSLLGTYKNYNKIATRKDSIFDLGLGYERYVNNDFSITGEFNLEYNKSKDSYYSNINLGPALYLSYSVNSDLETYANISLNYTSYSNRTFQTTVKGKTISNKEHQTLTTTEVGAIYNLFKNLVLQAKYTSNVNTSNNSTSSSGAYKSHLFGFNIGLRF